MIVAGEPGMKRAARLLFWAAALFALVMALLPNPPQYPGEPGDKVQHMAAFATLALLGALAFPRLSLVRLGLGLSLFGALIEVAQAIPELHRDSELMDWVADSVAAAVILVAAYWLRRAR